MQWSPEDMAIAFAMRGHHKKLGEIGIRLGRTQHQVGNMFARQKLKADMESLRIAADKGAKDARPPRDVLPQSRRSIVSDLMGDPDPGRSAQDKKFRDAMIAAGHLPSQPKRDDSPIAISRIDRPPSLSASASSGGGNFI